jgi:hypothetical protein
MPADDLVLNVRQIAGYTPVAKASQTMALLVQIAGLGSAYASMSPQDLVGTALANGGDMAIAGALSAQSFSGGSGIFSNFSAGLLSAQQACIVNFSAAHGSIGGVPIATLADLAAQYAASVQSFNGRVGNVRLWIDDIRCAGGAPIFSPRFEGEPRACTPPPTSNSSRLATTAFVQGIIAGLTLNFAPLDSPAFTGVPTAPTAPVGSSDGTLATTAFVQTAVAESTAGVASFNTRTGIVTLTNADVTAAGGAVLNSPAFTGTPTAPTPPPLDSSTRIATTAFVLTETGFAPLASPAFTGLPTAPTPTAGTNNTQLATTGFVVTAIAGISVGVSTFNGRSGAVSLLANDITAAGGAILASPAFTGTPTAPNPPPGDSSTRLATTAYVQSLAGFAPLASPNFTGLPTAPTPTAGTNTQQLATTAFVLSEIAGSTAGVSTFNGRTGAVTLQANDLTAAGGALLNSPGLIGTPTAPTAAGGTNSTQLATCAFVAANFATTAFLAATYAPLASPTFTGTIAGAAQTLTGALSVGGALTPSGGIVGAAGGTNAASGQVGEVVTFTSAAVSVGSGVVWNIGSITIPAGDWDLSGTISFQASAAVSSQLSGGMSNSATVMSGYPQATIFASGGDLGGANFALPVVRINSAASTIVYANSAVLFTSGTVAVTVTMFARRRR